LIRLEVPFREPFVTAGGRLAGRELLILRLENEDGAIGVGEAAPLPGYDGQTIEGCAAFVRRPGAGGSPPPAARACLELAELDLRGRSQGLSTLGGDGSEIAVNLTIPAGPPDRAAELAAAGRHAGHDHFKVKVGLADDEQRLAAVRAAIGPQAALRVDANGAWTVAEALRAIGAIEHHGIEFVEQPCATLPELAELRRSISVPIAADESIRGADDVREAARQEACDIVCLKLSTCGGPQAAREALREAERAGLGACLSSTLDGPWGISAALRLAATERVTTACGLATLNLFSGPLADALADARGGTITVPPGTGLGIALDPLDLAEVTVEELED